MKVCLYRDSSGEESVGRVEGDRIVTVDSASVPAYLSDGGADLGELRLALIHR